MLVGSGSQQESFAWMILDDEKKEEESWLEVGGMEVWFEREILLGEKGEEKI